MQKIIFVNKKYFCAFFKRARRRLLSLSGRVALNQRLKENARERKRVSKEAAETRSKVKFCDGKRAINPSLLRARLRLVWSILW